MSDYPHAILAVRYLGKVLIGSRGENERPLMDVRRDTLYVDERIKCCSTSARYQGDIICLSHYYEWISGKMSIDMIEVGRTLQASK